MTERPPIPRPLSAALRAHADRACASAGTDLETVLAALTAPDAAPGAPDALQAGWNLLDAPDGAVVPE